MKPRTQTILIVDDDEDILDMLMLFLEECGYRVQTSTDGAYLHTFSQGMPDLLLLDIWLSGYHGGDLCRQLKSQPATRHLPILLVSANRETEAIAREVGADGFISKPFDLDYLLSTIKCHLGAEHAGEC